MRSVSLTTPAATEHLPIPEKVIAEISLLSRIAEANGSLVSIRDIVELTNINLPEEQIERCWQTLPDLAGRFELKAGFIRERGTKSGRHSPPSFGREIEKRTRAKHYSIFARAFTSLRKEKVATIVAVGGSISYQSATATDDLDFFLVTKSGFLWTYLVKSMLLARAFRIFNRKAPRICFSYAVDEEYANKEFSSSRDPLFARDALTLMVVHGTESYKRLLTRSVWMSKYYPQLLGQRSRDTRAEAGSEKRSTPSPFRKFLNQLVYSIVSKYIATKSEMLNRGFRKAGKSNRLFTLRTGPDYFVIESVRYSRLRKMYGTLDDIISQDRSANLA